MLLVASNIVISDGKMEQAGIFPPVFFCPRGNPEFLFVFMGIFFS